MEKISVIVPVYQVADYLEKCVDAIRRQSYENLEILLVDDGSTDGSAQLCDELAGGDARITAIHRENAGVSAARNAGLARATGEYVCFCDADDYVEPDMYEYLLRLIHDYDADVSVCSGWYEYGPETSRAFEAAAGELALSGGEALLELHRRNYLRAYIWNKMFRRECLGAQAFSEGLAFAEDYDMFCGVLQRIRRLAYGPEMKYHYIQRRSGACNDGYDVRCRGALEMFRRHRDQCTGLYPEQKRLFDSYYMYDLMGLVAAACRGGQADSRECRAMRTEVRAGLKAYLTDREVALYLKMSAMAISLNIHLFGVCYRLVHRVDFQ